MTLRPEDPIRDLEADLKMLTLIPRDPDDPTDMVHDVVAPHALRRAIAAEAALHSAQQEIAQLREDLPGWKMENAELREANVALLKGLQQICEAYEGEGTDIQVARKMVGIARSIIAELEQSTPEAAAETPDPHIYEDLNDQ